MKKLDRESSGLGKILYMEWIFPIIDYYLSLRKNEIIFEVVLPILTAVICTITYWRAGIIVVALDGLAYTMPTALSVLIGFTIMLVTLLLTSSGPNMNSIKETETDRIVHGKRITLYQGLHIQFSHSLFSEIFLLLLIFFYMFLKALSIFGWLEFLILLTEIYMILNILLSVLRGVTNLYFSFFKNNDVKK